MAGQLNLVVLGKQGAGKGTQSQRLAERYSLAHISTGDILRAAVKDATPLGLEVKAIMEAGQLVSDELVNRLVEERYTRPDAQRGGVLDGFPRTLAQANALEELLGHDGIKLCVNLEVPIELVTERLSSRRVCTNCATSYRASDASALSGVCAKCGGEVVQRSDDRPEAIRQRLEFYERDTAPLLDFYAARGLLVVVNGDQSPDAVTADIVAQLDERGLA